MRSVDASNHLLFSLSLVLIQAERMLRPLFPSLVGSRDVDSLFRLYPRFWLLTFKLEDAAQSSVQCLREPGH